MAVSPTSASVERGGSVEVTVELSRSGGFTGAVTLEVIGLPTGVTSASTVATGGSVSLTISAGADATLGSTTGVLVRGSASGFQGTVERPLSLTVTAPDEVEGTGGLAPSEQVVTRYGVVAISSFEENIALFGEFFQTDPTPLSQLRQFAVTEPLCMIGSPTSDPPKVPPETLIDAGTPITLRTSQGTVLVSAARDASYVYSGAEVGVTLPADVRLSVPGSNFPAFSDVQIPPQPPELALQGGLGSGSTVTAATELTWEPAPSVTNVHTIASFMLTVGEGAQQQFAICAAPNTGSLRLAGAKTITTPDLTFGQIGNDFEGTIFLHNFVSYRERLDAAGGAVLTIGVAGPTTSPFQ